MTIGFALNATTHVLNVTGSPTNDVVRINYGTRIPSGSTTPVQDLTTITAQIQTDLGYEVDASYRAASVRSIRFNGNGGNDLIDDFTAISASSTTKPGSTISTSLQAGSPGANAPAQTAGLGVFTVGSTGQVGIDYLYDGAGYRGQVGIFSLAGMQDLTPGSAAYNKEAARRILSNTTQGHVAISVQTETARFDAKVPWEADNWAGHGSYLGPKSFAMTPGDTFGVMLVPNGLVRDVSNNPSIGGSEQPIYSIPAANPYAVTPQLRGQAGDLDGRGSLFAFEDLSLAGASDRDYNDVVFQVTGARGDSTPVADVVNPSKDFLTQPSFQSIEAYAAAREQADPTTGTSAYSSGTFTVGSTGQVSIDYLYDGAGYQGEMGVFSLQGMGNLVPGSAAFIQEATRRALSNSVLGHVAISVHSETGKNDVKLSWEADYHNGHGSYQGPKTFAMTPGDTFATLLIPADTLWQIYNNPSLTIKQRPLFSIPEANAGGAKQLADLTGAGTTFGYEDLRVDTGQADGDYNDQIFRVAGATGTAPALSTVVNSARNIARTGLIPLILA